MSNEKEKVLCPKCKAEAMPEAGNSNGYFCPKCGEHFTYPQQVFYSYGHTSDDIVIRIRDEIQKRLPDYRVWIDLSSIDYFTEWREEIIGGIAKSQCLLAFVSEHSMRSGGVCSDEIALALCAGTIRIAPILLNGDEGLIPPYLKHVQFINLSAIDDDEQKISECVEQTVRFLREASIEGDISKIRDTLHPKYPSYMGIFLREYIEQMSGGNTDFVERTWLRDAVLNRFSTNNTVVLTAEPGAGKSTFSTYFAFSQPQSICLISCRADTTTDDIRNDIVFALGCRFSQCRSAIIGCIDSRQYVGSDEEIARAAMEKITAEDINGKRADVYAVIDGIDVTGISAEEFSRFLSEPRPAWLKLLITSRPNAATANFACIKLDNKEHTDDLAAYVFKRLRDVLKDYDEASAKEIAERMIEAGDGSFLYIRLMCDDIISGAASITDAYPPSISGYYQQYMERVYKNTEGYIANDCRKAFSVLCASPVAVPCDAFGKVMNMNNQQVMNFVAGCGNYVRISNDELSIFHKSFSDWLCSRDNIANPFYTSAEDGKREWAECCMRSLRNKKMTDFETTYIFDFVSEDERAEAERSLYYAKECIRLGENYAWAQRAAAGAKYSAYDMEDAERLLNRAVEISGNICMSPEHEQGAETVYVLAKRALGDIAYSKSDYVRARESCYIPCLRVLNKMSDTHLKVTVLARTGDTWRACAQYSKALLCYLVGKNMARDAYEKFQNSLTRRNFSVMLNKCGDVYMAQDRYAQAEQLFRKSLALCTEQCKSAGKNAADMRAYALVLDNVGDCDKHFHRYSEALEEYMQSLSCRLENDKGSTDEKRDVSFAYDNLGDVYYMTGDMDNALKNYRKSFDICKKISLRMTNQRSERDLSVSLCNLGDVMCSLGRNEEALVYYEQSLKKAEKFNAAMQSDKFRRDLAISCGNMGDVLIELNRTEEAKEYYEKCLLIREELASNKDYAGIRTKRELAVCRMRLGDIRMICGDTDGAAKEYEICISVLESIDAQSVDIMHDCAVAYDRLVRLGKVGCAERNAQRFREVCDADSGTKIYTDNAAAALYRYAELTDDAEKAKQLRDTAYGLWSLHNVGTDGLKDFCERLPRVSRCKKLKDFLGELGLSC